MLRELSRLDANVSGSERAAYLATVSHLLFGRGLIEEAKRYLSKAEKEDRNSPPALYVAGMVAMEEQDMKTAARMWERLLRTDVAYFSDVIPLLEKTLYQSGRFQELEELLTELIRENPGRPSLSESLASFHMKKGETEDAIRVLESARESTDLGPVVSARLAAFYVQAGRADEARAVLDEFDANMKQPVFYHCSVCGKHAEAPLAYCDECAHFNTFRKSYEKIRD
jgi:lipopolysaccharide biosynthesis regulator YciM